MKIKMKKNLKNLKCKSLKVYIFIYNNINVFVCIYAYMLLVINKLSNKDQNFKTISTIRQQMKIYM